MDEEIIDEELSTSAERATDERLHKQLRIFWIILIVLQGLNLLPGINGQSSSTFKIIIGLIPLFFYYTIVIKKQPRFITLGLLYLVLTTIMSIIAFFFAISATIGTGGNPVGFVLLVLIALILGFQIWGIILHGKYKME